MNNWISYIRKRLQQSASVKQALAEKEAEGIGQLVQHAVTCFQQGGKILLCGNGGSAADSQHIAAELVGRFQKGERKALPAVALTTDTSILLAVGNDCGFEEIFARQVEALGMPGDMLIGISTSGRSKNVVRAVEKAKAIGLLTVVWTGDFHTELTQLADLVIRVPSQDTALIQESHIAIGHLLCDLIEKIVFPELFEGGKSVESNV